jgi:hypothetical protein
MHGSLLIECPPGPYLAERRYILEVVLGEFLGLAYRLEVGDRADVRVSREGDPDGGALVMPDVLFATPEALWATPAVLPTRPLPWWCAPGWVSEGHEISTWLPVIYGRPGAEGYFAEDGTTHHLGVDVFGSAFFMLSRLEEVVAPVSDRYGRFPATASLAHQEGFLERPIVNEYVELLFRAMRRLWPGLTRKRHGYRLLLSHDVDLPFFTSPRQLVKTGWQDLTRRHDPSLAASRLKAFVNARVGRVAGDPFNTFDWLMRHSERVGVASSFNFIAGHTGGGVDGNYRLDDPAIRALITEIHARGHELGLHPSYHTFNDAAALAAEYRHLRAVMARQGVEQSRWGGRQHYLRWQAPHTWRHWEAAGLDYDSTLAYADRVGFRCGTCYAFPAYDVLARRPLALVEVPLAVMDITLTVYMGLSLPQAVEKLLGIGRLCRMFGGCFVLLWHNSSLILEEQKFWYASALKELTAPGAWMGSHKAS